MKLFSGFRQVHAIFPLMTVLVVFLCVAAVLSALRQRGLLLEEARLHAETELELIGTLAREALIKRDYATVEQFFSQWGLENADVVKIEATAANGFVLAFYDSGVKRGYLYEVSRDVRYSGRTLISMTMRKDFSRVEGSMRKLLLQHLAALVLFALTMGGSLWYTLRRTAILPMERLVGEVNELNKTLETRVRERTADLVKTTEVLEREIGERLKAEEGLRKSEERYRQLFNSGQDAVFVHVLGKGGAPGTFIEVNEVACRRLGYTREELLQLSPGDIYASEQAKALPEILGRFPAEKDLLFEMVYVTKAGGRIPVEINSHLFELGGERVVLSVARDITERKKAEAFLQKAKDELERQNVELKKLDRMKDALISDISHELKTPVAKHLMQLEVLRQVLGTHGVLDAVSEIVDVMGKGIRRQENAIRNILLMSRLEAGGRELDPTPFRLDRLLEDIINDYMHAIAAYGIRLEVDLNPLPLVSDKELLWHVFSNLVNNAIKYRSGEAPALTVWCEEREGKGQIRIADNGVGLTREEHAKAFERFFQTSPSTEGLGLGLNIAKTIVERIGGSIRIDSEGRTRGTTVTVVLPLRAPGSQEGFFFDTMPSLPEEGGATL